MSTANPTPVGPTSNPPQTPTSKTWLTNFTQNVAFDIMGLGFGGAAIYAWLFTKNSAAAATLTGLAGAYLGLKAPGLVSS